MFRGGLIQIIHMTMRVRRKEDSNMREPKKMKAQVEREYGEREGERQTNEDRRREKTSREHMVHP